MLWRVRTPRWNSGNAPCWARGMKPTPKEIENREPRHLPVEPEMEKGLDQDQHGHAPGTEPPKEKRTEDL